MKKILLGAIALLSINAFGQNVNIPDVNFKNALLDHGVGITATGVSIIDTDGDGNISQTEAQAYTGTIYVTSQNISDLTGIEAFINTTALYCAFNQLTSIDVSANTALNTLYCRYNQLTSLDVSVNTVLSTLNCRNNQLTSLNVANGNNGTSSSNLVWMESVSNPNLSCIQHDSGFDPTTATYWSKDATASWSDNCPPVSTCSNIVNIPDANFKAALLDHGVGITTFGVSVIDTDGDGEICETEAQSYNGAIDVTNQNISDLTGIEAFLSISTLYAHNNSLTSIDLSNNTSLTLLNCSGNSLNQLDLSNNSALLDLECRNNLLSDLDLSLNTSLRTLNCTYNNLSNLNVANSNNGYVNPNLYYMDCRNNNSLSCIQHDSGFNATTAGTWFKDATASWSDNCSGSTCTNIINIPDVNFKAALLDHGVGITTFGVSVIDTDGDGEICITEAQSYTGLIDVSFQNINDLSGIEEFTSMTNLFCDNNNLTSIDVSQNTALTFLNCGFNSISSLDVTQNTQLQILYCRSNNISTLDVSQNTALVDLRCYINNLSSLSVSQNILLEDLRCGANNITSLDVSGNPALSILNCTNNSLTSLNVANGNNGTAAPSLYVVYATGNPNLTCIQHDTGFDPTGEQNWLKDATASWSTNCGGSTCTNIVNIPDANFKNYLVNNTTINTDGDNEICITEAQSFTGAIICPNSNISDLTGIEEFTSLTILRITGNQLTSLDLSNNIALTELNCPFNQLTSLDLSNNVNLDNLACFQNPITSLDLSGNPALQYLNCSQSQLSTLNVANGNNTSMLNFNSQSNPNLTCIQVDDAAYSTANWLIIDPVSSFSENCTVGSQGINENNISFSIVPNPTSGIVTIDTDVKINSVEVYSMTGQKIQSSKEKTIDLSDVRTGVYFVKVLTENGSLTKRVIKK